MWPSLLPSDHNPPQPPRFPELTQIPNLSWGGNDKEKNTPLSDSVSPEISLWIYVKTFLTSTLPHQIYLYCLLRLPYLYYSRVSQIFQDANLTLEEVNEMGLKDTADWQSKGAVSPMPKAYSRLKKNWQQFIDILLQEWKTLNIVSGLLLS